MTEAIIDIPRILNVLSDLYLSPPKHALLEGWKRELDGERHDAIVPLKAAVDDALKLDGAAQIGLETEFARLFVGPASLPCPPWESVYTSPGRLMMQEAYEAVRSLYADAGLALKGEEVQADHIGVELHFLALLYDRYANSTGDEQEAVLEFADELLDAHLNVWVGPFTTDVENSAHLPFYKTVAQITRNMVSLIQE